jgi:hypothetical protein
MLPVGYFIASALGGLAIPFLLFKSPSILHGPLALLLIILMFEVAFLYSWNFNEIYLAYFGLAIILYTYACLSLNRDRWSGGNPPSLGLIITHKPKRARVEVQKG